MTAPTNARATDILPHQPHHARLHRPTRRHRRIHARRDLQPAPHSHRRVIPRRRRRILRRQKNPQPCRSTQRVILSVVRRGGRSRRISLELPKRRRPTTTAGFLSATKTPMSATIATGAERFLADSAAQDVATQISAGALRPKSPARLPSVSQAAGIPRLAREIPPLRWRGRSRQIQSAADGGDPPGQRHARREHAAAAPHVSRARAIAAALFPPRRSARALQNFQRIQARGHMDERLDHALRLLPVRARRLPVSGRGISFHRHRRADALHPAPVAIPHQPQPLSRSPARFRAWPARRTPATSATPG